MPLLAPTFFANEDFAVGIEGEFRRPKHFEKQRPAAGWAAGGGWWIYKNTHGLSL